MPIFWIVLLVISSIVVAVLLGIKIYWSMLLAFLPERERANEVHTIVTRDVWEIKLFRYRRGRSNGEPVLLVHGAGVNHHNFTEPEGASLIDELVARGLDCWAIDVRLCRSAKPAFERVREDATVDDVLLYDLPAAIRYIRKTTSYGRVHWVGHSQGGMLLYAYLLYWGNAFIASGTTLGSPIGFDGCNLKFKQVPKAVRTRSREIANVFRGFIPLMFLLKLRSSLFPMNMKNLHPKLGPGSLFHAVEDPVYGALDQLIGWARTREWKMVGGQLDVKAGLGTLDAPLFTLFAPGDPFVSVPHAKRFFEALPNPDKKFALLSKANGATHDYDHCDMAFGLDAPRLVFGPIADWIQAHPITERVRAEEISEDDIPIRLAIDNDTRATMLSGEIYAKLHAEEAAPAVEESVLVSAEPAPVPAELTIEPIPELRLPKIERPPAEKKAAAAKTPGKPAAKPTAKKTVTKKATAARPASTPKLVAKAKPKGKPAAKAKPAAAPKAAPAAKAPAKAKTKPASKPAAKPAAKLAAKPATKPVAKPAPKVKSAPEAKPAAKPTPAPAKKPAPVAKPTPAAKPAAGATPRIAVAPSKAEKAKPSRLTQSAILSASDLFKDLDGKKK